jgi:predicted RNA-binding protein
MCESSVWVLGPDGRTQRIAEDILIVRQEGEDVVLHSLLREARRVPRSRIVEIDSLKHAVTLLASDASSGEPSATRVRAQSEDQDA